MRVLRQDDNPFDVRAREREKNCQVAKMTDVEMFDRATMGILKAPVRGVPVEFCDFRLIDLQE